MIVTIDGPAGAGKSTVSRRVAGRLGLPYLNSGFIYRAVTWLVLEQGGDFDAREEVFDVMERMNLSFKEDNDTEGGPLTRVFAGDREITAKLKEPAVTAQIFQVANNGDYRARLVDFQRRFAEPDGVVAEGRDMGTVIFPDADHKFYLDASVEERARRQHAELCAAGRDVTYEQLLESVRVRDRRDSGRQHAPLRVADGAVVVDSDGLSIDEVVERIVSHVKGGPSAS